MRRTALAASLLTLPVTVTTTVTTTTSFAGAQSPAVLLRDVRPGNLGSGILGWTEMQGRLYFVGQTASQYDLFATDGTPAGTVPFNVPARVHNGAPVASATQVWFLASTTAHGQELWASDGTPTGTRRVTDLNPGATDAFVDLLTPWHDYCFFMAVVPLGLNYGLWRSDGTAAGTVRVGLWTASLRRMIVAAGKLWLVVVDPTYGDELWVLDDPHGTPRLVRDIRPGPQGSNIVELVGWRGKLWFNADDGTNGNELWCSDGTTAGTVMMSDVNPFGSSQPSSFRPTRDWLFFIPRDVNVTHTIMQTDGTPNGEQNVPHNPPLIGYAGEIGFTTIGNVAYARAATQALSGVDLWRMDGTNGGTVSVRGSNPSRALEPQQLRAVGSRYVYFQGDDGVTGTELWRSDGTTAGTALVADVVPGAGGSAPYLMRELGSRLVFLANTPGTGYEPFAVPLDAHGQAIGDPCGAPARATTLAATDPVLGQTCTLAGSDAAAGSSGYLFLGLPAAAPIVLPVGGPSCRWLLTPTPMLGLPAVTTANGLWSLPLPIPNDPAFQNVLLRAQGVFAPTDGVGGLDVTNAANLHLGR